MASPSTFAGSDRVPVYIARSMFEKGKPGSYTRERDNRAGVTAAVDSLIEEFKV